MKSPSTKISSQLRSMKSTPSATQMLSAKRPLRSKSSSWWRMASQFMIHKPRPRHTSTSSAPKTINSFSWSSRKRRMSDSAETCSTKLKKLSRSSSRCFKMPSPTTQISMVPMMTLIRNSKSLNSPSFRKETECEHHTYLDSEGCLHSASAITADTSLNLIVIVCADW